MWWVYVRHGRKVGTDVLDAGVMSPGRDSHKGMPPQQETGMKNLECAAAVRLY
jgi:hypothetical protein